MAENQLLTASPVIFKNTAPDLGGALNIAKEQYAQKLKQDKEYADRLREIEKQSYEGWSKDQEIIDQAKQDYLSNYAKAIKDGMPSSERIKLQQQEMELRRMALQSKEDKSFAEKGLQTLYSDKGKTTDFNKGLESYTNFVNTPIGERQHVPFFEFKEQAPKVNIIPKAYTDFTNKSQDVMAGLNRNYDVISNALKTGSGVLGLPTEYKSFEEWKEKDREGMIKWGRENVMDAPKSDLRSDTDKNKYVPIEGSFVKKKSVWSDPNGKIADIVEDEDVFSITPLYKNGNVIDKVTPNYTGGYYNTKSGDYRDNRQGTKVQILSPTIELRSFRDASGKKQPAKYYIVGQTSAIPLNKSTLSSMLEEANRKGESKQWIKNINTGYNEALKSGLIEKPSDYEEGAVYEWSPSNDFSKPIKVKTEKTSNAEDDLLDFLNPSS